MYELTQSFVKLPNMYQQNILGVVRHKIQLYKIEQIKNGFDIDFKVPESKFNPHL
jgi:homoserine trans-succinylase